MYGILWRNGGTAASRPVEECISLDPARPGVLLFAVVSLLLLDLVDFFPYSTCSWEVWCRVAIALTPMKTNPLQSVNLKIGVHTTALKIVLSLLVSLVVSRR